MLVQILQLYTSRGSSREVCGISEILMMLHICCSISTYEYFKVNLKSFLFSFTKDKSVDKDLMYFKK